MKALLRVLLTAILCIRTITASAATGTAFGSDLSSAETVLRQHLDSLSRTTTGPESIDIIYSIFDLLPPAERPEMGRKLYRLEKIVEGYEGALDAMRLLTLSYKENSRALNAILAEMQTMEDSEELQESILLARIYLASNRARSETPETLREKTAELISSDYSHITGHYERLLHLFTVCMYVREMTHGPLLAENLRYLDRELEHRPLITYAIRRQYADMKAQIFSENEESEDAVKADRELLATVNAMDADYGARGRKHMALHWFRYRAYTRMLLNFSAITDEEAHYYYTQLNALADSLPEVRAVYNTRHYPDIFYLLKTGDYAAATPLLKKALQSEPGISRRRYLLRQLVDAAMHLGDNDLALAALTEYTPMLEKFLRQRAQENNQEMVVSHNLAMIRKQALENELNTRREKGRRRNIAIICSAIAMLLIITATIQLHKMVMRYRKAGQQLLRINDNLTKRRNMLQSSTDEMLQAISEADNAQHSKSMFIRYISSTIVLPLSSIMEYANKITNAPDQDETCRRILQRFAVVIEDNSQRLRESAERLKALSHGEEFSHTTPTTQRNATADEKS